MTNLLYRSFDVSLSVKEQSALNEALFSSKDLWNEKKQIEKLRTSLRTLSEQSFSPQFVQTLSQHLLENINRQSEYWESLLWAFKRIAFIGMLALTLLGTYNFYVGESVSFDSLFRFTSWQTTDITQIDTFGVTP